MLARHPAVLGPIADGCVQSAGWHHQTLMGATPRTTTVASAAARRPLTRDEFLEARDRVLDGWEAQARRQRRRSGRLRPHFSSHEPANDGPGPDEILHLEDPTPEDLARIEAGQTAEARIVEANLGLVITVATQAVRTSRTHQVDDLVQEGVIGLLEAIERFDPDRGVQFSTYAIYWVRRSISRALTERDQPVRSSPRGPRVTTSTLEPDADGTSHLPAGALTDEAATASFDQVDDQVEATLAAAALDALDPLEARLLRLRLGLPADSGRHQRTAAATRQEAAQALGLTERRAAALEAGALTKLRHPAWLAQLRRQRTDPGT